MKNKLPDFYEQHPDFRGLIGLNILGWEEELGGNDFIADIAENDEEDKAQYETYIAHGYKLHDQNMFGRGTESYRISCYVKK